MYANYPAQCEYTLKDVCNIAKACLCCNSVTSNSNIEKVLAVTNMSKSA